MPDYLGDDMRKTKDEKEGEEKEIKGNTTTIILTFYTFLRSNVNPPVLILFEENECLENLLECLLPLQLLA